jgi:hypothetical protein
MERKDVMKYKEISKKPDNLYAESEEVASIAKQLSEYMDTDSFCAQIEKVHKLNGKSQAIQSLLEDKLLSLKFASEKKGLFTGCAVPSLRPDFYRKVGKSGILVEIERGKTIANNMDLLDLWKCHHCAEADFLFLIVPCLRENHRGQVTRIFDRVEKRMESFFDPIGKNYVNVEAVHLFGY